MKHIVTINEDSVIASWEGKLHVAINLVDLTLAWSTRVGEEFEDSHMVLLPEDLLKRLAEFGLHPPEDTGYAH